MQELIKAFILIFIAEMGDKTQILAMAFATRYAVNKVLLGIFLGAFLNHGLAVLLGSYLSRLVPVYSIQVIAGFAFIGFALWTLKPEDEGDEDHKNKSKLGPVFTVAAAFFIGELGDKTQLTAITLAADASYPAMILAGTVLGMVVTGGLGIFVGKKLGDRLPEVAIKLVASAVFLFFGISKLYTSLPDRYLNPVNIILFAALISASIIILILPMLKKWRMGHQTPLIRASKELHEYYNRISRDINSICLGVENCGRCEGNKCIVGYTKSLIKCCMDGDRVNEYIPPDISRNVKPFSREQAIDSLILTLNLIKDDPNNIKYKNVHDIRRNLEMILFGKSIEQISDWDDYMNSLMEIDESIAATLFANNN